MLRVFDGLKKNKEENSYTVVRVESSTQQILFSAENTIQGVFMCILTSVTTSESPTAQLRLQWQNTQREFIVYNIEIWIPHAST